MLFLYYLLARDEERRMVRRFGEGYRAYVERTGMFGPRVAEHLLGRRDGPRPALTVLRAIGILLGLLVVCVSGGFILRGYTVRHLPLAQVSGVDAITITTEDLEAAKELLPSVLAEAAVASNSRLLGVGPATVSSPTSSQLTTSCRE